MVDLLKVATKLFGSSKKERPFYQNSRSFLCLCPQGHNIILKRSFKHHFSEAEHHCVKIGHKMILCIAQMMMPATNDVLPRNNDVALRANV